MEKSPGTIPSDVSVYLGRWERRGVVPERKSMFYKGTLNPAQLFTWLFRTPVYGWTWQEKP